MPHRRRQLGPAQVMRRTGTRRCLPCTSESSPGGPGPLGALFDVGDGLRAADGPSSSCT
ncbi:hypothetical protein [Streptomyces canus]|uniref:hypothetical protein n=1 Tax=Streptomyces canus TaxID=58343 RepID=UPI0030E29908